MAFKKRFAHFFWRIIAGVLLSTLFCAFAIPAPAFASDLPDSLPTLDAFMKRSIDGNANVLRGVYVPNVLADSVVQQPTELPGFVSTLDSTTTQFRLAADAGNIGLLAHNFLAGSSFSKIIQGDRIILVYGDGRTEIFLVESILRFQALDPLSPYSLFKDLETQNTLTAEDLFNIAYRGQYHVTLQTCIEKEGELSWGRLFIIAKPISDEYIHIQYNQTVSILRTPH